MADVKRISKNTLFLFFRMGFLMLIGLYTTRTILEALGIEDLGINNVVSSMVLMFDFASSSLTNSTQRYLNIGLGRGDAAITRQYFSQSLSVHILLAILVVLLLESIGVWLVQQKLVISEERMTAAMWCYQLSVISVFIRIVKICFDSNIIARERMSVFAYIGIFEGIAKLVICFLVIYNTCYDRLIYYSFLLFVVSFIVTMCSVGYCLKKFPESHYRLYWNTTLFREMLSFIGVNSFGVAAWAFGIQGINIVLNMFFGPVVNGAKGIASTVQRVVVQFSTNIDIAVKPQITKAYAKGDINGMLILAEKSSKYIFYLVLFLAVPILFETDAILQLWLKEVPQYASVFIQIMMIDTMIHVLTSQYVNISNSIGRIKGLQIYGRLFTLSGLPLSYIVLRLWCNPYYPVLLMCLLSFCYFCYAIYDMNRYLHFGIQRYLSHVFCPVIATSFIVFFASYCICLIPLKASLIPTFIFRSTTLCVSTIIVIWLMGIERKDKETVMRYINKKGNTILFRRNN